MLSSLAWGQAQAQDTLWVRFDNRFKANVSMPIQNVDSIEVTPSKLRFYNATLPLGYSEKTISSFAPIDESEMSFVNPGRYLLKPSTYAGTDYTNAAATSGYNFAHSQESEHYALFWDVRYGEDPNRLQYPGDGNVASAKQILNICERCWDKYTELGFIDPNKSVTQKYKIQLYVPYQSEWRADASGTTGANSSEKTGIGHFNPWAANARGGHTVAHEVGHTFQYLVSADLGMTHGFNYGYGDGASGRLILRGFGKKVLIADTLAPMVNAAYAAPASAGGAALLAATVFFALQIYGDFSGYSDIAVGTGRLLGIRLSENFRRPYAADSLRDFWRRWHVTLTRWMTDYLYIPLGGSRRGRARQCLNTVIVFLLSGLWHGAGLTYAAWGLAHGLGLSAERLTEKAPVPAWLRRLLTLAFVALAWVLFRAESLADAWLIWRAVFTDFRPENLLAGLGTGLPGLTCALLCALMLPAAERLPRLRWEEKGGAAWLIWLLWILAVVLARCAALSAGGDTAFIYFQF